MKYITIGEMYLMIKKNNVRNKKILTSDFFNLLIVVLYRHRYEFNIIQYKLLMDFCMLN